MLTEKRIDALATLAARALENIQLKAPADDENVKKAKWGPVAVYGAFYPIEQGLPLFPPKHIPSVLVMPLRGETRSSRESSLRVKFLVTVYEPGDRVDLPEDAAIGIGDLRDAGAGWRSLLLVMDKLRGALFSETRVPGSDLSVEKVEWSLYTADQLVPDLRPYYCAWLDATLTCGEEPTRSAAVADILN